MHDKGPCFLHFLFKGCRIHCKKHTWFQTCTGKLKKRSLLFKETLFIQGNFSRHRSSSQITPLHVKYAVLLVTSSVHTHLGTTLFLRFAKYTVQYLPLQKMQCPPWQRVPLEIYVTFFLCISLKHINVLWKRQFPFRTCGIAWKRAVCFFTYAVFKRKTYIPTLETNMSLWGSSRISNICSIAVSGNGFQKDTVFL